MIVKKIYLIQLRKMSLKIILKKYKIIKVKVWKILLRKIIIHH